MPRPRPPKPALEIHPTPFKPSHLSIPPSPFSPRTPLPLSSHPPTHRSKPLPTPDTRHVPPRPLQWRWQCHQCRRTYSLGVTRRCLEDGHAFCAGTTTTAKPWRRGGRPARVKRHRACASEFDYQGWKAWGRWRRSGRRDSICEEWAPASSSSSRSCSSGASSDGSVDAAGTGTRSVGVPDKDCWNACDYPSECRWGKRFGVRSPVEGPRESFETVPPAPSASEGILKPENCKRGKKGKGGGKTDLWGALVASATRRKSVPPSSPLAGDARVSGEQADGVTGRDTKGDVVVRREDSNATQPPTMASTVSPAPGAADMAASSPVVTLKEMIRKSTKRSRSTCKLAEVKEKSSTNFYEQALEELPQLERVKSNDSGYCSTPEMGDIGRAI